MEEIFVEGPIPSSMIKSMIDTASETENTGALNLFLGQIRADDISSKTVTGIDYSCYESMAIKAFESIISEAYKLFELENMVIYHSLGLVPVGGISLAVFVTSIHRKQSFLGLEWIVESIKKNVPIFGKEIFEEGDYKWKVNK